MSRPVPAGFGRRLAAALVDAVATLGVIALSWPLVKWGIAAALALTGLPADLAVNAQPFAALGVLVAGPWLYWAALEAWTTRGTVGKALLGIRVRTGAGAAPTFARASGRFWLKALLCGPLLPVGLLALAASALDRRGRTAWDLAAGTLVAHSHEPGLLYELPVSTVIIPSSTRTGKVSTGS